MLLELTCPACGHTLRATDEVYGQVVRCPACEGSFPVAPPEPALPDATADPRRGPEAGAPRPAPSHNRGARRTGLSPWFSALFGGAAALTLAAILARVGWGPSPAAPMPTAQVVARCEPSVALIRGKVSSGTGFLARPDIVATNAHVIDDEFLDDLEVAFPSAPGGLRGPFRAELLYEDLRRDLAFLAVRCGLPELELARSYRFLKGEDVLVIGSPGLGEDVVLENAISRGVMSSRTAIDGQDFLQMSISINPGNSGGPILDAAGRVIGVAALRSSQAESLGFGIPVEDLNAALIRLDLQPEPTRAATASRHRARAAFRRLTGAGALYAAALKSRAAATARSPLPGPPADAPPARPIDQMIDRLERRQLGRLDDELAALRSDSSLPESSRRGYEDLASNYRAMKELYLHPDPAAESVATRAARLRVRHLRLAQALGQELGFPLRREHLAILESGPQGESTPDSLAGPIPAPIRPRPGPFAVEPPPIPIGPHLAPDGSILFDPARDARARSRAMQKRLDDMRRRMESLRPRHGP